MARPGFKRRWTRFVPQPIERSDLRAREQRRCRAAVRCVAADPARGLAGGRRRRVALQAGALLGFGLVLYSTFLIDHFDLFGLRQVLLSWRGRPYTEKRFVTPQLYRFIRHPLYVGWMITFWATPTLSVGHLLFARAMTAYILIAIRYEERDLAAALGEPYRRWRAATPMFVPRVRARAAARGARDAEPS